MAIFAASSGAGEGYATFENFSRKSPKYDRDETHRRWQSYEKSPPDRLGFGTLYHLAKENGLALGTDISFSPNIADVAALVEKARGSRATTIVATVAVAEQWQEPQDLFPHPQAGYQKFPIESLPTLLRDAVIEVQAYVQAPMALVASSAISALSLAGQASVDVRRDSKMIGPSSLFMLTIAESGERKSTTDKYFLSPINEFEASEAVRLSPEIEKARSGLLAFNAKRKRLLKKIEKHASDRQMIADLEKSLALLGSEPLVPRVPQLIRQDDTPEVTAKSLAFEWPSVGIITAEAGIVFGGHAMNDDNVMKAMARLNTLWDGDALRIGRVTSESFVVRGARITLGLMIQEEPLRKFLQRAGVLARGIGFLARCLICRPRSTMGTRMYREPLAMPNLAKLNARILQLLKVPSV
jgi:putative DNA primase/helicase